MANLDLSVLNAIRCWRVAIPLLRARWRATYARIPSFLLRDFNAVGLGRSGAPAKRRLDCLRRGFCGPCVRFILRELRGGGWRVGGAVWRGGGGSR